MDVLARLREYWDADAQVYDRVPGHGPGTAAEQATWSAALARLLPPPPARVLDAGAGTGFLSLLAARLGHEVTALDLSPGMLARLASSARAASVTVRTVEAPAHEPPEGPFDAVVARHLMWTLPDPLATLRAWRAVVPGGRVVLFEGVWREDGLAGRATATARELARRASRRHVGHHAQYDDDLRARLPLNGGTAPDRLVDLLYAAGWHGVALERLRDVEWARRGSLPPLERLFGVPPRFAVSARA